MTSSDDAVWRVQQIILDPEDAHDWALDFVVDLTRSRDEARAVLALVEIVS